MESIFKPVHQVQKISAGADPKSVLCLFFKQGLCTKGDKCKFSHDLSLENKAEKRSMYVDSRDDDLANGRWLEGRGGGVMEGCWKHTCGEVVVVVVVREGGDDGVFSQGKSSFYLLSPFPPMI